jgi:ADP-ribosylglycohydrolase
VGLALGDALSWPALFHRSYAYPFWTRRLRREMDAASEDARVLRPQMPFSLNQPTEPFAPGPTDDTEWAAFVMQTLLDADEGQLAEASLQAWRGLADAEVRGSVSTQAALSNLRKDLRPPHSGRDNPHYFDDAACARAVPFGVLFAGQPERAAAHAEAEAQVTNADVGVQAAGSVAAAVSVACAGGRAAEAVDAARARLPAGGWAARTVASALDAADAAGSLLELGLVLAGTVVNREYNYGSSAPETLAVALALTQRADGDLEQGILAATAVAKVADAAAPLVGALCGALTGDVALSPPAERSLQTLSGLCVPSLGGADYLALVDAWVDRAARGDVSPSS